MHWRKIDPQNLPEKQVLAANFQKGSYSFRYKLVGRLFSEDNQVWCQTDFQSLEHGTHYVDIDDIVMPE